MHNELRFDGVAKIILSTHQKAFHHHLAVGRNLAENCLEFHVAGLHERLVVCTTLGGDTDRDFRIRFMAGRECLTKFLRIRRLWQGMWINVEESVILPASCT